ncbi:MAG: hypothetical protein COA95_01740 [Methylophaga sp.]|nr:MAG: hypothetical protein COA95_01740 [Methylophaga sp.]
MQADLKITSAIQGQLFFILVALLFAIQSLDVFAEEETEVFDSITVEGENLKEEDFEYSQSVSSIQQERIEEKQSSNVMELLDELPGISSHGGPLSGGMGISIRGFGNNEDVIVRIDGATQNFEKYRYGIGLSIDPELLKQVKVSRGSAILERGSGALGGVVEMETIDARDLLTADENWGAKVKYGHRSNNDGDMFTLTAFGRPTDYLDILLSGVKRDTNDFRLPNGERFDYSEETQESGLAKVELFNDFSETTLTYRTSEESGQELHDARAGSGTRGYVYRTSEEDSYTFNTRVTPASDWFDIKATIAYTDKYILDDNIPGQPASLITGNYQYDIWTTELVNESNFKLFGQQSYLTVGAQYNQEDREVTRLNGSVNNSQPAGTKQTYGLYVTQKILVDDFTFSATLRGDKYSVDSKDLAEELLEETGRSSTVEFTQVSPAFSIGYEPASSPFSAFYSYAELFRSPLIDEYFTLPGLSGGRCRYFSFYHDAGPRPRRADYPSPAAHAAAVALWNLDQQSAFNQDNAICADFYDPEESKNHEISVAYMIDDVFTNEDSFLSKLTFFYTEVGNTLGSIYQNTVTGEISQPGIEVHRGIELELKYDSPVYFGSLVVSTLDGYQDPKFYENNPDPAVSDLGNEGLEKDLIDKPADKVIFTIGRKFQSYNFKIGYKLEAYDDNLISRGIKSPPCHFSNPACIIVGSQPGYALHDIFAVWQPTKRTVVRLNIDNITNKEYLISGIGETDNLGPGIDVRLSVSQQF